MKSDCSFTRGMCQAAILLCLLVAFLIPVGLSAQTPDTLWIQDWESGWGDWWVESGQWQVGTPTYGPDSVTSGVNCAGTVLGGDYTEPPNGAGPQTSRLISPVFVVPANNPRLRFNHWYNFSWYDSGRVQIRVDGGVWETISSTYVWASGGWTRPSLDLSAYVDSTVEVCFVITTENAGLSGGETAAGWYVDDIMIETGPIVFNNPENFESGLGDWWVESGQWQVGTPTYGPDSVTSGVNCAGTVLGGDYIEPPNDAGPQTSRLISPVFIVPANNPRLRFNHWYDFNAYDSGRVQIRVDGGVWETISSTYVWASGGWTPSSSDLSAYVDSTVEVCFVITTENAGLSEGETAAGWYVDDIRLQTSCPFIHCPQDPISKSICQIGDEVCVTLPIEYWTDVSVDGATWANDTLCFTADTEGEYNFTVVATNAICADTCNVTVNVAHEIPMTLSTDNLSFFTYDTASVLPEPQYIHISSTCPDGTLDWNMSLQEDITWLGVDKTSGSNPDSVQVSIVSSDLSPGIYAAWLEFTHNAPGTDTTYAYLSIIVESGVDVGDFATPAASSFSVPVNFYTTDSLESFVLPLKFGTTQPGAVHLDSVIANDSIYRDSVIFDENDASIFVFHPFQPPPPPDSVYELGRVYVTVSDAAVREIFLIDTVTAVIDADTLSYQFTYSGDNDTVPYFNPGWIWIDTTHPTPVEEIQGALGLPDSYLLAQNYPNPFNPATQISFELPAATFVRLDIFNVLGQRVRTLADRFMSAGNYNVVWRGDDTYGRKVASGVYFYRLATDRFTDTKKMLLLK